MIMSFYEDEKNTTTFIRGVCCNTPRQRSDIELLLNMVDDLVASALASPKGELGYINFINARENFTRTLLDISKDYVRIDRS